MNFSIWINNILGVDENNIMDFAVKLVGSDMSLTFGDGEFAKSYDLQGTYRHLVINIDSITYGSAPNDDGQLSCYPYYDRMNSHWG